MKAHKIGFEWNKITPYIYIGTNRCCQAHFDKTLLKKGVRADISVEKEKLDAPWGIDYFLWLPTRDKTAPNQKKLRIGVDMIKRCVEQKEIMYIHCKNGHGRAPILVAAYLIEAKGFTVRQAISFIKKRRTTIHLEISQKKALEKFRKSL